MKTYYSLWCEWDIGQEGLLFTSPEKAMKWAKEYIEEDPGLGDFQMIVDDGLIGTEVRRVYD